LKVRARDLVGYGVLYLAVNGGLVLVLMWLLARTLPYAAPLVPQ